MINRLSQYYYRRSTLKGVILFVILYLLMAIVMGLLPENGTNPPFDLKFFGYDESYALTFLGELTPEQRQTYIRFLLSYDLIYPLIYGNILIVILSYLSRMNKIGIFNLTPLLIIIFDYIENSCSLYSTYNFPTIHSHIVQIGSIFTILKWALVLTCILAIFYLLILQIKRQSR